MKTATKLNSNHPSSPSSENSVYFDAADSPTMRFFGRKSSTTGQANDQDVNNNTTSGLASGGIAGPSWETEQPSFPEPDPGSPPGAGQVDADTQPSVTIPPDHNVNQFQPAQTNGTYNSVPEPQSGGQSASSAVPQDGGTGDSLQRNEPTSAASVAPISDSGYDSPVTNQHRRSKSTGRSGGKAPRTGQGENVDAVGQGDKEIKPIPVLWTDAAEGQANVSRMRSQRTARGEDGGGGSVRRSGSTRSSRSGYGVDRDRADQESIRTTPSMRRRRVSLSAGSFAGGAGTVGPNADADIDDSLSERRDAADAELTKKQKQRLSKVEGV